ncbi:MAG: N-acetylmuramoyl-L-alanine amidase [Negativicutes bacterium]|nr:N-acetylmuramoyl-L-alanine amidase [Negativicutes bacterium]
MYSKKLLSITLLLALAFNLLAPVSVGQAAGLGDVLNTLSASTAPATDGGGVIGMLVNLLFKKVLDPILNIFHSTPPPAATGVLASSTTPAPQTSSTHSSTSDEGGILQGKVVVVDPGHGGSNPGAVANGTRESDNNLAVGRDLRDRLVQAGAKVIMTRDTDRTVAPEGSTLEQELQARVDITQNNHADIFVSIHSNENSDPSITGAETFYYPRENAPQLATDVENAVVNSTHAVSKGTSKETFYVLRNNAVPSILVEMGFVSSPTEAARLASDSYRYKVADGIYNGIVKYFQEV